MLTTVKLTRANAQGSFVIKICKCAGLMSESLALVDLLVLAHARHFAGLTGSSFSWVVRVRHCVGSRSMSTAVETLPLPSDLKSDLCMTRDVATSRVHWLWVTDCA